MSENNDRTRKAEGGGGCVEMEVLLGEYAEGVLAPPEAAAVETHLAGCARCAEMADAMRRALALFRRAPAVEPPPGLVAKILEQTTGRLTWREQVASWFRPALTLTWRERLKVWYRPVLEPRLVLGLAMALISFSIVLRAGGVEVRQLSLADLSPRQIYLAADRYAHQASARAVKYYSDLRIVYEIQTQLQALREGSTPPPERQPEQRETTPQPPPAQNKWSNQAIYLAAALPVMR